MRWRPPTRPLILIALLLLAGALVNVAVAWVLVGAPDSWTPGGARTVFQIGLLRDLGTPAATEDQQRMVREYVGAPRSWTDTPWIYRHQGLGWRTTGASNQFGGSCVRVDAGWPLHSLMFIEMTSHSNLTYSLSIPSPQPLRRVWGWNPAQSFFESREHRLPLSPLPAGFAINTLFYAAILALPLSFFPIRRRLRARRGRCAKCGYDLAGLGDPAAPCPECGAAR